MDDLFVETLFRFCDDVSWGGLLRDGSICRNGEFFHGGSDTFPADLGLFGLEMLYRFSDTVKPPRDKFSERLDLHFADIVHYGHRYITRRNGEAYRGGVAYRDGTYSRDGMLFRNGCNPGETWEHFGASDLSMDELFTAAHLSFFDGVSESDIRRNGEAEYDGKFRHGGDVFPVDFGLSELSVEKNFEDDTEPTDVGGSLSFLHQISRCGYFSRDGTTERGGYSYDDDLSGSLSLLSIQRGGVYCRDGSIETAADGRLIAI